MSWPGASQWRSRLPRSGQTTQTLRRPGMSRWTTTTTLSLLLPVFDSCLNSHAGTSCQSCNTDPDSYVGSVIRIVPGLLVLYSKYFLRRLLSDIPETFPHAVPELNLPRRLHRCARWATWHGICLFLWSPYVIGQTIIFLPCGFFLSISFLFSSPNLSGHRSDVYHGVALVRI